MSKVQKASKAVSDRIIKITIYALVILAVLFFAQKSFALGRSVFSGSGVDPAPGVDMQITVLPDDSTGELADKLLKVGLINDKVVFYVQSICFELEINEETAGTYRLNTSQSGEEIIRQISTGNYNLEEKE